MSDPVTNVEIEDVLSSIRKLVAEDSRTAPRTRKPEKPERLVLTPAQRVKDDAPAPRPSAEPVLLTQPVNRAPNPTGGMPIDDIPRDARLADFGDVEGAFPDIDSVETKVTENARPEQTPEKAEENTSPRGNLDRLIEKEVAAALGVDVDKADDTDAGHQSLEDQAGIIPDDDEDFDWADFESDHDAVALVPEDASLEGDLEDIEVDHAAEDLPASYAGDAEDDRDSAAQEDTHQEASVMAVVDPEPTLAEPPAPPQTLEDKVAALGRLVARDSQEFEEERDRPDADDLAATSEPMTWPDVAPFVEVEEEDEAPSGSNVLHAENAWPQAQVPHPVEDAEPEEETLPSVDTGQAAQLEIDEEILRELVGDIVRQELQGALGERITRNVRKLVRREIHRMLISQEFD